MFLNPGCQIYIIDQEVSQNLIMKNLPVKNMQNAKLYVEFEWMSLLHLILY